MGDMAHRLSELIKKFNAGTITSEEENEMEQLEIMLDYGRPGEAQGGRIGFQSGGITETRNLPPEYIEALGKTYAADLTKTAGIPSITTAVAQQPGETAQQWQQRQAQAQQYGITKAGMAELAPQVAAQDPYQAAAYAQAVDPTKGLGGYQPYLTAAGTAAGGLGALTGAQAYQPFMSPYQTQVIDESMRQYDLSRQAGQQQIRDAAVGAGGFGGGREGAQLGQYDADTLANRTGLQAQLLAQGYGQAQQGAQQAFQNQQAIAQGQLGLGQAQMGLSNFQRAGLGQDVGALGQMGSLRQGLTQAQLAADQQMHKTAAYEPYGRLSQYGTGITGLAGGMAGPAYADPQQTSPWASALSTALGVGGLWKGFYGQGA